MIPVRFHPEARAELRSSARYYESQRSGLGRRFLAAVRDATEHIRMFPGLYRVLEDDVRRCRVKRFPYGLLFRTEGDHIQILAVMHLHRRTGYWRDRLGAD